jgi:hypothetical protein
MAHLRGKTKMRPARSQNVGSGGSTPTTYQPPYTMGNSLSNNEAIDNDNPTILSELSLLLVTLELVSSHLDDQETWYNSCLIN